MHQYYTCQSSAHQAIQVSKLQWQESWGLKLDAGSQR